MPCPSTLTDADRAVIKRAFDDIHQQVYGQSAPKEDAEIVTFRLQSEINVPRLTLPEIKRGDASPVRAKKGSRKLFDFASGSS